MRKKQQLPGTGLDDIIMPTTQKYYDWLHDKIMARIEDAEMETPARSAESLDQPRGLIPEQVRLWLKEL